MEIMDFPGNFSFLEKLKLYQNYLKKGSMLEKTKGKYWLYGKAILYWVFSEDNDNIGIPISSNLLVEEKEITDKIIKIASKISKNEEHLTWIEENCKKREVIIQMLGSLCVMGFVNKISRYEESDLKREHVSQYFLHCPKEVNITVRGFLMGELLYEIYSSNFWERKLILFQLKWAVMVFFVLLIILILSAILVFIDYLRTTGILYFLQQNFSKTYKK